MVSLCPVRVRVDVGVLEQASPTSRAAMPDDPGPETAFVLAP